MKSKAVHFALTATLLWLLPSAHGDIRIWDGGGVDNNWTTAANWSNNIVPVAGDDLVFPSGAARPWNTNTFSAGTVFNSLTLTHENFKLYGNAITLNAGLTDTTPGGAGSINEFACNLTLASNQPIQVVNVGQVLILDGAYTLNGKTLTFDSAGEVDYKGIILGAGQLQKTGTGNLHLKTPATFTGPTTVSQGALILEDGSALGATGVGDGTTVEADGELNVRNNISVTEPITLAGTLRCQFDTNTISGNLSFSGSSSVVIVETNLDTGVTFTLSGPLSGAGALTKSGNGKLTISGNANNIYSGGTFVNEGVLRLNKTPGFNAIPGALTIGDGDGGLGADVVQLLADSQIINSAAVTVSASGLFDLNGHADTVGSLAINGGHVQTGAGTLTLGGNVTSDAPTNGPGLITGNLALGAATRTFNALGTNLSPELYVAASVSGSVGLTKTGPGGVSLSESNSYTGVTTVNQGTLEIWDGSALGTTAGGTVVNNGATLGLRLAGGLAVGNEALTLSSTNTSQALENFQGSNSWSGPITLSTDAVVRVVNLGVGDALFLNGVVSGAGKLTKTGTGPLILAGTNNNSYTGATVVNQGTLRLNKTHDINAVPGPLIIGDGSGGANADVVELLASNEIEDTAPVIINSSGLLDLQLNAEAIGSLAGSGNVNVGFSVLTVGGGNTSTNFSGVISGSGGLTKVGSGTQTLSGTNTYTGATLIQGGRLLVNGAVSNSIIQVLSGGTLGGTGHVGKILVASNGVLNVGASPGILTCTNVTFNAGSTFAVELNGTNAGTGYDQLIVNGTVAITNCALSVSLGFTPAVGNTFTIIANDASDAIAGTFTGLTNNATFGAGNTRFRINYNGGTGSNDVVLTVIDPITGVTKTWTGNGANALWSNATNWVGTNAPVVGDNLTFAAGAARLTNTNDFASGTLFNAIILTGSNYVIGGNAILLNGRLDNSPAANRTNMFNCDLTMSPVAYFTCASNTTLNLGSDVAIAPGTELLFYGEQSTLIASGVISGNASIVKEETGLLVLSGSNTFSGSFAIDEGILSLLNASALGSAAGGTVVNELATLTVQNNLTIPDSLTLIGTLLNASGDNTFTGTVLLGATNATVNVATNSSLTFSNAFSGNGGLIKTGPGVLNFAGTNANTYTGPTVVNDGVLALAKSAGTTAIPAALVIGDGVAGASLDQVQVESPNQIADTAAVTITTSGLLNLDNNNETIGPLSMDGGGILTGTGTLTLNGDVTRLASASPSVANIFGQLSLGGVTRKFTINTNASDDSMSISAVISDGSASAGLTKTGAGRLTLAANNSYTGPTIVAAGTLDITRDTALGSSAGGTVVSNGAFLLLDGNITVAESPVILFGKLFNNTGTNTLSGAITLGATNVIVDGASPSQLTLSGPIGGSGGLTLAGGFVAQLSGSAANTYSGGTTVIGTLFLGKTPGADAIPPGPVYISGTVHLQNDDQIANTAAVTLDTVGVLDLADNSETIGSLAGALIVGGQVTLGSFGSLAMGGDNTSTVFGGLISGVNGTLAKNGSGTMTLSGNNSYTGTTFVNAGTLLVNGSQPNSDVVITGPGTTLGGRGTVGAITAASATRVSPGASAGILSSGIVTLNPNAVFVVELNGTNAGTSYDQLNVTGNVSLNNGSPPTLQATLGFAPPRGTSFTIIANDGSDPVGGTFSGMPEGAVFAIGGTPFQITYRGGSGSNDVVLTRTLAPSATFTSATHDTNGFIQLQGSGLAAVNYSVEATTNLNPFHLWTTIGAAAPNGSGQFSFTDTNAPSFPTRFYRLVSP